MRFDTATDGGIELITGTDDVGRLAADLAGDPGLDRQARCRIVAETGDWYFARPIRQQLADATGCA